MCLIKAKKHSLKGQCTWQFLRMEKHSHQTKQTSSANVNQQLFHFLGGKKKKNHRHKLISLTMAGSWDKIPHNTIDTRTLGFSHVSIVLLQKNFLESQPFFEVLY